MILVGQGDLAGLTDEQRAAKVQRWIRSTDAEPAIGEPTPPRVPLPTIAPVARMVPVWRGAVIDYTGSLYPLLGMLAAASGAHANSAAVNLAGTGRDAVEACLLAVHEMGGDLAHIPVVNAPVSEVLRCVRLLLDGMALVVVGLGRVTVPASTARILAAQARANGCTLVLAGGARRVEGADIRMAAHCVGIGGLGRGKGRVTDLTYTVTASLDGRTVQGRLRTRSLPGRTEWIDTIEEASQLAELSTGTTG